MPVGVRNSGARQDTWNIIVQYRGNNLGLWDKKSGGEVDSDETKYFPGGMKPAISLGGRVTPGNVTLSRIYDRSDDNNIVDDLLDGVGKGTVTISQRALDVNGNPVGKRIIYHGKLKRVTLPDVDSESSAAAMIEIEVAIATPPTVQSAG